MSDATENEGVLSRWSKRKLKPVEEEPTADPSTDEQQQIIDAHEAELAANQEAAEAINLDMIDEESDLSLFLKEGVPEALKKAALAKLWRSNPVFANVDGLVDYGDNFADPNLIMKTFTSAYQVGRGYLKEVLEDPTEQVEEVMNTNAKTLSDMAVLETDDEEGQDENELDTAEVAKPVSEKPEEVKIASLDDAEKTAVEAPKIPLRKRLGLSDTANKNQGKNSMEHR